jgi:hypothetical protein
MYPVYYKKTERSDSTIRQSTFDIRHSLEFHTRCQDLAPRFPDTRNLTPETYLVLVDGSDITDYPKVNFFSRIL